AHPSHSPARHPHSARSTSSSRPTAASCCRSACSRCRCSRSSSALAHSSAACIRSLTPASSSRITAAHSASTSARSTGFALRRRPRPWCPLVPRPGARLGRVHPVLAARLLVPHHRGPQRLHLGPFHRLCPAPPRGRFCRRFHRVPPPVRVLPYFLPAAAPAPP